MLVSLPTATYKSSIYTRRSKKTGEFTSVSSTKNFSSFLSKSHAFDLQWLKRNYKKKKKCSIKFRKNEPESERSLEIIKKYKVLLAHLRPALQTNRNKPTDSQSKRITWFLYDLSVFDHFVGLALKGLNLSSTRPISNSN